MAALANPIVSANLFADERNSANKFADTRAESNELFPIFLKLNELKLLIVGGGYVGLEKVTAVLQNSQLFSDGYPWH